MSSGLYQRLIDKGLLVPHEEVDIPAPQEEIAYKIIQPKAIPFISYPYEWCFSQLKKAALTTLEIQKIALEYNMSLKDASAYNIQFINCHPVLVDTLSFEKYKEGRPWIAYRQFCQHFLAPLALMSLKDIRLGQLLRIYIDGIPLDLASLLLPRQSLLHLSLLFHLHLHAKASKLYQSKTAKMDTKLSKFALLAIIDSLETAINKLKWKPTGTQWADYYDKTNYSTASFESKKNILTHFLNLIHPSSVWDLGANTGLFSRIASQSGAMTVSFDIDPSAVEKNYLTCLQHKEKNILPLLLDLTNPSPGIGWESCERISLIERGPVDCLLALALIHHLAIGNNVPMLKIAQFFSKIGNWLIIEFVPKSDSQVQKMLATREDIFLDYTKEHFEAEFGTFFTILKNSQITGSERILYLMKRRN